MIIFIVSFMSSPSLASLSSLDFSLFSQSNQEGFTSQCPTQLYRKDGELILVHEGKQVKFANLEEYRYFVEAMRMRGIRCPVLYLETTHDAQGGISLKQMDDPLTPTTGLMRYPANYVVKGEQLSSDPQASTEMPVSFDPQNQNQGGDLPVDRFFDVDDDVNPASAKWKGAKYTQQAIDAGEMRGDTVLFYKS